MPRVILIGGGGFAKEVSEVASDAGIDIIGYVAEARSSSAKLPYLGSIETAVGHSHDGVIIAFGAVDRRSVARRRSTIAMIRALNLRAVSVISPHARVSSSASIGSGSYIGHNVIVSVDAVIGEHCVFNNGCQIGHDAVVGDNVTAAPAAFIAGNVVVGDDCLLGPNSSLLQGVNVAPEVVVGVGSIVLRDVPGGATVVPARSKVLGVR